MPLNFKKMKKPERDLKNKKKIFCSRKNVSVQYSIISFARINGLTRDRNARRKSGALAVERGTRESSVIARDLSIRK